MSGDATATGTRRGPALLVAAGVLVLLMVVAGLTDRRAVSSRPYDPTSVAPDGLLGLVRLLEAQGSSVRTGSLPGDDVDVAVVFVDDSSFIDDPETETDEGEDWRDDLDAWVRGGGTLVVADPASELVPLAQPGFDGGATLDAGRCDDPAGERAPVIAGTSSTRFLPDDVADTVCYVDDFGAWLVRVEQGDGSIVGVGDGGPFTNAFLDEDDSAVLAVDLLTGGDEGATVAILEPDVVNATQGDPIAVIRERLLGGGTGMVLAQLTLAFVVYAVARGRRLGRPVAEARPVELAGSELVRAVGGLYAQTGQAGRAAVPMRRDLHRELCGRLGLPPETPAETVASVAAARTAVDPALVVAALSGAPVRTDADLVALTTLIDHVRQEVLHGQPH